MQNGSRNFAFMAGRLRVAAATSLIWAPLCMVASAPASAQDPGQTTDLSSSAPAPVVPQQVRYSGKLATRAGDTVEAVFRIYAAAEGGEPLWTETQRIAVAEDGSYTVLLGSASPAGLPQNVFTGGVARWLAMSVERAPELERALLSSVPYAMKSADAESLAGHAAADFVTQEQLAALAAKPGIEAPAAQPDTSPAFTGSGTAGTVPLWTGALALGNSEIVQVGTDIGIHQAKPATTLDVGGAATIRGTLALPPSTTATKTAGSRSQEMQLSSSAWSTATNAAIDQTFTLFSLPTGNDTAKPAANLYFQFQQGTGSAANIASLGSNGVFNFAPAQTFPGTIKSVSATSPLTAATTSGAVSLGLNLSALATDIAPLLTPTLGAGYAQLATYNDFVNGAYFAGAVSATAAGSATSAFSGNGTSGASGFEGGSDTGIGVWGLTENPKNGAAGVLGITLDDISGTYSQQAKSMAAGVWGDSAGSYNGSAAGVIGTADDYTAGYFVNNGPNAYAVYAFNGGGSALLGESASGNGVAGVSNSGGDGVYGYSSNSRGVYGFVNPANYHQAGVEGVAVGHSSTYNVDLAAAVWGDNGSPGCGTCNLWNVGVAGTTGDNIGGYFTNNSPLDWPTIYAHAYGGGGTGLFKTLMAATDDGVCGFGGKGDLTCTGQVKTLASTAGGARTVETYAMQSPENWMEDFGSGALERGVAVVSIEPAFAETITADSSYHVFITPNGDSKSLYVINKTATSFEVRESGGGTSSLSFDYRIVSKRRGYEAQRLTDVTDRFRTETARATHPKSIEAPNDPLVHAPIQGTPRTKSTPRVPPGVHPTGRKAAILQGHSTQP